MTTHMLTSLLVSLAAQGAEPQSRPAPAPRVAAIAPETVALLDRVDRARFTAPGGKRPATLSMRGQYRLMLSGAPMDKPWKGPVELDFDESHLYERMDYGEQGLMQRGWNADVTWEMHPVQGVTIYRDEGEDVMRRCLQSIYWPGWRALYRGCEESRTETFNGRPHHVLKLAPRRGKADVWHVDAETFLPSRVDFVIRWGGEESTIQVEFSDWRAVGGLLVAHKEKTSVDGTWGDCIYDSVTAGAPVAAERFAVPPEVAKALATNAGGGFQVTNVEAQPVATVRVKVPSKEISKSLAIVLPEVMAYLTESGARTAGAPFMRTHGESGGMLDIEAGLPVAEKIAGKGRIAPSELPGGRAAAAWHIGPYAKLPETHAKLEAWMKEQGLEARGGPWEIYWTDPGLEPDSTKWRTQILWPVK